MTREEKFAIGIDLGGTSVKSGIVSGNGKIVKKISIETKAEEGPKAVIKQIKKSVKLLLEGNRRKIEGIGIGAPGTIEIKKGTVENPPNFPGWGRIHLGSILEHEFGMKTRAENDANAAAIGEMIFGAGKKLQNFILVTLGTGVGGGLILGGKLFRGESGGAGEIGHMTIDYNGKKCKCGGTGCVEAYTGNQYLIEDVKKELPEHSESKLIELMADEELTPKLISKAAELNDEYAISIVKRYGLRLGSSLANAVNLLDVTHIIIGGGQAGFGDLLFNAVEDSIKERVLIPMKPRISVKPAKLKNDAGIKGASALVFYKA